RKKRSATGPPRAAASPAASTAPSATATPSDAVPRASASPSPSTTTPARPAETEPRTFPAGSYIVRMDQPYSRIADALLDYQYWAPTDPQPRPYDDTGWTFPEGFGVQAVRVTDAKVLDVAMQPVKGDVNAPAGVSSPTGSGSDGAGSIFAISYNGDNGLIGLRYRLKDADIQVAEEPFESGSTKSTRGSFVIRNAAHAGLEKAIDALGLKAYAIAAVPSVKLHPARAARVAILDQWTNTQT